MTVRPSDVQIADLSEDDRLLFDNDLMDVNGEPTSYGWDLLKSTMFKENKAKLVELVKKVNASKSAKVTEE